MLEAVIDWISNAAGMIKTWLVRVINSTYLFLVQVKDSMMWMDTPGTYILWMVIGFIYIPFFSNSVYNQYANPHGYYSIPLTRKIIMGLIFITAWIVFGYANLRRFIH